MTQQPDATRPTVDPTEAPILAEDLLLLLFQPDSGTIAGENTLFYTLAGGVLADLALGGHVTAESARFGRTRATAVRDRPPGDDLLRSAWELIAEKSWDVQATLAAVGPNLRAPLLDRLVARGDLRREERRVLGLIPSTRLSDGNRRRADLMAQIRSILVDGVDGSTRSTAIAALLSASGTLPQFDPVIPWTSPVIARAKELEHGNWGAGAAAEAVTRTTTAVIVNNVVVATAVLPRI